MPKRTAKQDKAIAWFMEQHPGYKLRLGYPPYIMFLMPDGNEERHLLSSLVIQFDVARKLEKQTKGKPKELA